MNDRLDRDVLIIGGGHAGAMAAIALRQQGFEGSIIIVGEEPAYPYERPPLSKAYFTGELEEAQLYLRKPEFWNERNIEVFRGVRVVTLERGQREAGLSDGRRVHYRWCILAMGGRPRRLSCPGAELAGVHYLRSVADVAAIRGDMAPGARIVVIGGGYVGLEVAASARKLGCNVKLIEAYERVLARVTSPVVSAFLESEHRGHGVDLRCGEELVAIEGQGRVEAVFLRSGERIEADLVIVGIGLVPNQELAESSGLACPNGVEVDETCRTADPAVFAIGDLAWHPNVFAGQKIRLESVQNAVDQAKVAARAIMGTSAPYDALPWFWSHQYDLNLQTAGLFLGHDALVVRGDAKNAPFSVIYLRDGRVIAADCINSPKDFMGAKTLIQAGAMVNASNLSDVTVPLKGLLARSG